MDWAKSRGTLHWKRHQVLNRAAGYPANRYRRELDRLMPSPHRNILRVSV